MQFGINEIPQGLKTSRFSHCLKLIQHCISKVYIPTSLGVPIVKQTATRKCCMAHCSQRER